MRPDPAKESRRTSSLAQTTIDLVQSPVQADHDWGLDHGTWSALLPMFPEADIPTFQLSIDMTKPPQWHFDLARQLRPLRRRGVLILASGNLQGAVDFQDLGTVARRAHPTHDHFLPFLYAIALKEPDEEFHHRNVGFDLGSISMRSLKIA